jgi:hypothetical protein
MSRFEEPKNVIFYDMGHSNTRATLVEYHSIRFKKGSSSTCWCPRVARSDILLTSVARRVC